MNSKCFILLFSFSSFLSLTAQEDANLESTKKWDIAIGATFSHFEQQVKKEVGGAKGTLIVDETNFSTLVSSGYRFFDFLSVGMYMRYDVGKRFNGIFKTFDSQDKAVVDPRLGGNYNEFWAGPYVKLHWNKLFVSGGYGLIGIRNDDARTDIPSSTNSTSGAFTTHPVVAMVFHFGGEVDLTQQLALFFALEYRIRYYTERDGNALKEDILHGTQNYSPLVGAKYLF